MITVWIRFQPSAEDPTWHSMTVNLSAWKSVKKACHAFRWGCGDWGDTASEREKLQSSFLCKALKKCKLKAAEHQQQSSVPPALSPHV